MRIKKTKVKRKYLLLTLVVSIISLIFLSSLMNTPAILNSKVGGITKNSNDLQINTATKVQHNVTVKKMIREEVGLIHKDSICSLYIANFIGTPNLIYVYKKELIGRELTDLIFIHIYLKDKSKLPAGKRFVNFDSGFRPKEILIDDEVYFYSKKALGNDLLKMDDIDYLNTGRYSRTLGRSYSATNIKTNQNSITKITNSFKTIVINIKEKAFDKIKAKRLKAINENTLVTSDDDLVPARISWVNDSILKKVDIRLKGDWIDHLKDKKKWSFRIKMKGENTMSGMRKFSIQHPLTRSYTWEWLFNKVVKQHDLIGLRYNFVNTIINVESKDSIRSIGLGIMAMEESFDKRLIENNNRREGILLAFNESYLWKDRNKNYKLNLGELGSTKIGAQKLLRVFNENKVLSNPVLLKQFNTAKGLVYEWKRGNLKISEVFDIDKLTFFVALSNLFGGQHGLVWHNVRFYYNPITSKLEPISFDSSCGGKINKIINYPLVDVLEKDPLYHQKLYVNLELVSSQAFVQNLIEKYGDDMSEQITEFNSEFKFTFDASVLEHNSNIIKKQLSPATLIISSLKNFKDNKMILEVKNFSNLYSVLIKGLNKVGGKRLSTGLSSTIVEPNETREIIVNLDDSFLNAFVSKKNKKGSFRFPNDLEKIKVVHRIQWAKNVLFGDIVPFYEFDSDFLEKWQYNSQIIPHEFVIINKLKKTILLKKGDHTVKEDVIIPMGYNVIANQGFNLDLTNGASLISYSALNFRGSKQDSIKVYSSDSKGGGVFVSGGKEVSNFEYCSFTNLSNPNNELWELSGSVNFNESNVSINNCVFEKSRCEDGLNIIRSTFSINGSLFKDTYSDAFDGDFVTGTITNSTFVNSGNDGIDVSGSNLTIANIVLENSSDKAISAGENSKIKGKVIEIISGEIGVVSKDLSMISLDSVTVKKTRLGLAVFQKKNEFGPGSIAITNLKLEDIELNYLVENNSSLSIDQTLTNTVSNKVIDKMYGKEYGKSSK